MDKNNRISTRSTEYERSFEAMLRGQNGSTSHEILNVGKDTLNGTYALPESAYGAYESALMKESVFRNIATTIFSKGDATLFAHDSEGQAEWVAEGNKITFLDDVSDDFTKFKIGIKKLATSVKADEDFVNDAQFDITGYIGRHMAKAVALTEDDAFVNGDGNNCPVGILCPGKGAMVGTSSEGLNYDAIIHLFFAVEPKYRKNGKWMMNDTTALLLRTLKDDNGNYLWNQTTGTILGKEVIICDYMPEVEPGGMPVAFGDFSYYWIIDRRKLSVRELKELFITDHQLGYLGVEYLDGMLTRRDAIKTLSII